MEDLINMIISDESPSEISDKIKEILFAKSSERIDDLKPAVASAAFDIGNSEEDFEESED